MSDVDAGLVRQYTTRVHQLAVKAQAGADIGHELGITVKEAVDHFAAVHNPAAQLEHFIGQLRFNAELVHESQPLHAATLTRAAEMASRVSTGPEV